MYHLHIIIHFLLYKWSFSCSFKLQDLERIPPHFESALPVHAWTLRQDQVCEVFKVRRLTSGIACATFFRFKVKGRWMCFFFKAVCSWKFRWKPPFAMCFWKIHAPSLCYSPQTPGMLGCPTVQTLSITQHSRQIGHYSEQKRKLAHSHPGLPDFTSLAKQRGLCHLK